MAQIVVCAENPITRAGLMTLATSSTVRVVGQVIHLFDLGHWLQTQTADLALIAVPALTLETTQTLEQMATPWPDEASLSMLLLLEDWDLSDRVELTIRRYLLQMLSTGRVSLLPLTLSAEQLQSAIAALTAGLMVLHPEIAEVLSPSTGNRFSSAEGLPEPLLEPLTTREIEVLNQLAAGLSNKAIASDLGISEHTVKFHISAILSKLGAASRTEAVTVGIRTGLVML